MVIPPYRGQGDPRFALPAVISCSLCSGQAVLVPYLVGYGYDCIKCGLQTPIYC